MAQVRMAWTETWKPPKENEAVTSFRLVQVDDDGEQWAIEREFTDQAGRPGWQVVVLLNDSDKNESTVSDAGLTPKMLAAMLAVIYHKRRF